MQSIDNNEQTTIKRTLKTALLIDGFWDRWIVHGIEEKDIRTIRPSLTTLDHWVDLWSEMAEHKVTQAKASLEKGNVEEAELLFRKASLYFNLVQYIFPAPTEEKQQWYERSLNCMHEADLVSTIKSTYVTIKVDDHLCYGRIRIPTNASGCIIIINPIDSTKEELYTYEMDFNNQGMMTVSFDSPGQGETFILHGFKGTQRRLQTFVDDVINYTSNLTSLPIYLFGTSLGASWAVYGSCHPKVNKVVAVSPTDQRERLFLPSYFNERVAFFLDEFEAVPNYDELQFRCPVLIYHGGQDGMVPASFIDHLLSRLPDGKKLVIYEQEGHCCNYELAQIRSESLLWFKEG